MTLQDYLRDPCGTLSIPYWKNKTVQVPNFMRIVHARDYDTAVFAEYTDELYFRLKHDLHDIPLADKRFICRTAGEDDLPLMAEIINRSYTDLSVTVEQLQGYRNTPAFAPDLWIIVQDAASGETVGCGIADFDSEAKEGVLEWIQVLPEHRGRGAGQFIVNELLRRMQDCADFATVSGKVNNATNPEGLYRRCGFTGADVWHILTKK
jgi:ribosomal protein S18 acetylase RimI-like enzyme